MWYDVNNTLSHNCLWNFVVGPRGVGKTFSCKRKVINDYLRKGKQFVYLRRYDTEIKASQMEKFWDDIEEYYPEYDFGYRHGTLYIDSKPAGFCLCLSKAAQYKSVPFPDVHTIIFDEFIIDQGMVRYLPQEVQTFCEMYSTISRLRDVTVLFLSNAITFTNPYFLYFDIKINSNQTFVKKGEILVEVVKNKPYEEKVKATRFGSIINGTEYGNYAMANEFLRDDDNFLEELPAGCRSLFILVLSGKRYCVYNSIYDNKWYVSKKIDRTLKRTISLDAQSHNEDTIYSQDRSIKLWVEELKQKYYRAELRFDDINAKNLISQIIRRV